MATKSVHWGRSSVHSDGWEAPQSSNEIDDYNNDYFNDNTPREDRPTAYYDDDAEEDYMYDDGAEYDDDFDVNQYDDDAEYDDRYDDDEWRDFERDYEYDYREHSGLCTGYREDYNDDDDDE